jgi:hypothetical protein
MENFGKWSIVASMGIGSLIGVGLLAPEALSATAGLLAVAGFGSAGALIEKMMVKLGVEKIHFNNTLYDTELKDDAINKDGLELFSKNTQDIMHQVNGVEKNAILHVMKG